MNTNPTQSEILEGVRLDISECVGIDLEETTPNSTFFTDLSGESIDVIDLMFRCEKRFGVRVELQSLLSDLTLNPDGRISSESIVQLQVRAPEIDWATRVAAINSAVPRDILTVDLIYELVSRSLKIKKNQTAERLVETTCDVS